jgi:RNA polymerase sigma factor (sigma-70 family)
MTVAACNDMPVGSLVQATGAGDKDAWDEIVKRYDRLVSNTARKCGLNGCDTADVCQTTWLRLWNNLPSLRQPERVGAWLAVTARREAVRVRRSSRRLVLTAHEASPQFDSGTPPADLSVLKAEQDSALWKALEEMPDRCQALLRLLIADPPLNYREISLVLKMPIGSIGPMRARCLACLRHMTREFVA